MKEALAKINELAGVLMQRIEFNNRVGKDTEDRAAKLNEKEANLDAKDIDLGLREQKIKGIENTISLREQTAAEKKEADNLLKSIHAEKDDFNKSFEKIREQLIGDRNQLTIDRAKVEKENVLLQKEWIELKKAKENMRADLINEIINLT